MLSEADRSWPQVIALINVGEFASAIALAETLVLHDESRFACQPIEFANSLYRLGSAYYSAERYTDCVRTLDEATSIAV